MDYQHTVTHWNYDTGICTQGVFRTAKEAEEFYAKFYGRASYNAEPGTKVYGIFESYFDAPASMKRMGEWMADNGGVTGRD